MNHDPDHLENTDYIVTIVNTLIALLYPDVPPDILQTKDILRLYRLTGFGEPAQRGLTRARRLVRARGHYETIGLCEFHTGLIYLHWEQYGLALSHFAEARHQWHLTNATAAICLSYFAEGCAHLKCLQREAAMGKYSKTEQWLPRIHFLAPTNNQTDFIPTLTPLLHAYQNMLRDKLWPAEQPPPAQTEPPRRTEQTAGSRQHTPPPPNEAQHTEPLPAESGIPTPPLGAAENQREAAPKPFITYDPTNTPIPAHFLTNREAYEWYRVENPKPALLPAIRTKAWVLVLRDLQEHRYQKDDLIIVTKPTLVDGGIRLQKWGEQTAPRRIYLARPQFTGSFSRSAPGEIELFSTPQKRIAVNPNEVQGVVVGIWHPFSHVENRAS